VNAHNQALEPDEIALVEANLGERYKVESLLGRGGMGAVYKVRDTELDKTFAIKVLNAALVSDSSSVKRFEQEARAASGLTQANLAAVYDYGIGRKGSPYIVMDYLDGVTLGDMLAKEGFLDQPRALEIFIQTGEAIAHAHMKGVIHRDIKPNNIIIEKGEAGTDFVKLVDFGIAKVMPTEVQRTQMTQTGEIFGSPLYMSPEQCLGNKLDARSDIYEMGCVMYETLTGVAPFAAENPIKTILRHINEDAKPISKLSHDFAVSEALQLVVMHCLEREPGDRYQTAAELLKDLEALRDGKPISVKPKKKAESASQKDPGKTFASVVAAIMLVFFVQFVLSSLRPDDRTSDVYHDAQKLDDLAFTYFRKGDYERAIPLLEFGVKTYVENGKHIQGGNGAEDIYLAENLSHIGKCYAMLHKYDKAAENYHKALMIYSQFGRYAGGTMPESVNEYAQVLKELGKGSEATAMQDEFAHGGNLSVVP